MNTPCELAVLSRTRCSNDTSLDIVLRQEALIRGNKSLFTILCLVLATKSNPGYNGQGENVEKSLIILKVHEILLGPFFFKFYRKKKIGRKKCARQKTLILTGGEEVEKSDRIDWQKMSSSPVSVRVCPGNSGKARR